MEYIENIEKVKIFHKISKLVKTFNMSIFFNEVVKNRLTHKKKSVHLLYLYHRDWEQSLTKNKDKARQV